MSFFICPNLHVFVWHSKNCTHIFPSISCLPRLRLRMFNFKNMTIQLRIDLLDLQHLFLKMKKKEKLSHIHQLTFLSCFQFAISLFFLRMNEWEHLVGVWRDCCFVGLAHGIYWTITYLNRLTFSNLFTCKTWSQMVRYWARWRNGFFQFSEIHRRMNGK